MAERFEPPACLAADVVASGNSCCGAGGTVPRRRPARVGSRRPATGRVGWPFVAADDDYVGVDLRLRHAARIRDPHRPVQRHAPSCLLQANGLRLPFADASFDAVLLIAGASALREIGEPCWPKRRGACCGPRGSVDRRSGRWRRDDGIDARMKHRLDEILAAMGMQPLAANRGNAMQRCPGS